MNIEVPEKVLDLIFELYDLVEPQIKNQDCYNVIRYQIENMNTHEKRIFNSYHEALKDYNLLATTDYHAHGCWRLIALLKEQIY